MSYENFVRVKVVTPVTDVATSFAILDAVAPQKLPPTDGGYLVLCDSPGNPSWIEVIKYTSRSGLGISGVTRGQEGTTAVAWSGNVYAFQALMAGEANTIQTVLAGKQDQIAAGTTSQFWRGDKTWVDFMTTVRAATLTGLSTSTNAVITATDTVLSGLGKLQKQISDAATNLAANVRAVTLTGLSVATVAAITASDTVLGGLGKLQAQITDAASTLAANVRATVLTGYVSGAATVILATDTILTTFGKIQGQLDSKAPLASPTLTGVPTAPTAASGTNTLQLSNTAFVQQEIAALIASAPGALNTLDELAAAMGDDANFAATMTTALAGKEPSIVADVVTKFYSGTKTWRDLSTDVRAVVLTGLVFTNAAAIVAGDTLLVSLGKLQKQITDLNTNKQAALGFTPVQQGTGTGQLTNVVKIGWTAGSELKVTVDSSDLGALAFKSYLANSATIAAASAATASTLVQRDASGNVLAKRALLTGSGNDYNSGAVEAQGNGATNTVFPTIGFHQPSMFGGSIQQRDATTFYFYNQGATDYNHLVAKNITATGSIGVAGGVSTVTLTASGGATAAAMYAKAASSGVSAPFYMYGESSQLRGVMYALNDNVIRFQAGSTTTGLTIDASGNCAVANNLLASGYTWAAGRAYSGGGSSWLETNGDVAGSVWGTTLSTYLGATLTDSNWRTKLANLRCGELGSFAMAALGVAGSVAMNSGVVGTSLLACNAAAGNAGQTLPGTWYCAGYIGAQSQVSLFQRYV